MPRIDIHRPSAIVYSDYEYAGAASWNFFEHGTLYADKQFVGVYSEQNDTSRCDHCGAHLVHKVYFHHRPTDGLIQVGYDCCERLGFPSKDAWAARKRFEALKEQAEAQAKFDVWTKDNADLFEFLTAYQNENYFYSSLLSSLNRYGSLTDGQIAALVSSKEKFLKRLETQKRIAEDRKTLQPVLWGKAQEISGEVLSVKIKDTQYGQREVMTLKDDRNFILWGSVPTSVAFIDLNDCQRGIAKGDKVSFIADIERSDDPTFGFFKRPRKATIIAVAI